MRYRYCPLCGKELQPRRLGDEGKVPWCVSCRRPFFDGFSTCILALAGDSEGNILLSRDERSGGRFLATSGYIRCGETAESAAVREIEEELGLRAEEPFYLGSWPAGEGELLMLGFFCRVERLEPRCSSELLEAKWFNAAEAEAQLRSSSVAKLVLQCARQEGLL